MPRQIDIKVIKVVALVLENHQGEVLIQQRKPDTHLAGFWEFPGGKVEAQETLVQALSREIKEELNYTTTNPKHLISLFHNYPEKSIELIVFHQIALHPKVINAEGQPLKWVSKGDLNQVKMPAADLPIIELLKQHN